MLEDREIIRRCQLGQRHLVDVLIDRHKTDLYSMCKKLARCDSEADDLFQDTWVNVMRNLGSYSAEHSFKTWLFAICLNRYRDLYRRRKRWWRRVSRMPSRERPESAIEEFRAPDPNPEQAMIYNQRKTAVRDALDKLEDMFRLPILLHYFQDLSMTEIGDIMGIPPGTVKSRLSEGRRRLKIAMEGAGHGRR